jgi:hypothetical protein
VSYEPRSILPPHAPAADGAGHGPILADQQLGALVAGNGATDVYNCGNRALLSDVAEPHQLFVNVHPKEL